MAGSEVAVSKSEEASGKCVTAGNAIPALRKGYKAGMFLLFMVAIIIFAVKM